VIAKEQGLSDIAAGRATLQRLQELTEARRDIAFETSFICSFSGSRVPTWRYSESLCALPAADTWVLMNNTARRARRIASRDIGGRVLVNDNELWSRLSTRYMKPRAEEQKVFPHPEQPWTAQDIEDAVNRAVTAALRRHKERGESVVVWRDGQIVTLKPEQIDV
jgi:hypothetical protein